MKRSTRIILSIIAWFVAYFILHAVFVPAGDMAAVGLVSTLSLSAAAGVYFFTGRKKSC
jgi:Zn-dependent protease with chaperone function